VIDRRDFLRRLERTALGACALGARGALPLLGAGCASIQYVQGDLRDGAIHLPLSRLDASGTALVEWPGEDLPLFVRRTAAGDAVALSTRCQHRGCQVEPEADRLVCPCHGSEYALDGAVLRGPTQRPLARFAVHEVGDSLVIALVPPRGAL
jgi:cytochrome b6-f complex iron-sulfur subunit